MHKSDLDYLMSKYPHIIGCETEKTCFVIIDGKEYYGYWSANAAAWKTKPIIMEVSA